MCVRRTRVSSVYCGPQTSVEQGAVGQQPAAVAGEDPQQVVLDRREVDVLAVAQHAPRGEVDLEAVDADDRLAGRADARRSTACRRATSSRGLNGFVT